MIVEQFVLPSLGHASYLVGSERTGEALVVDPRRDVDVYLEAERRLGLRITAVVDTHQHNDYVSGICELASRTGAEMLASFAAEVAYPHRPLKDGERIALGELELEVLHTPGHTPEHVSLLAYEGADEPAILLSGGALLVGDLARPDLLGGPEDKRRAARTFCATLQEKILTLPDHVLVYPTHVAGSLCGGHIGSRYSTTVGYEKRTNPILAAVAARDVFVEECLRVDDLPGVPPYWTRMRGMNQRGPEVVGTPPAPQPMRADQVAERLEAGAIVLDARTPEAFAAGHVPGSLNVGIHGGFPTWVGTVVPPEREIVLVLDAPEATATIVWELLRIGYPAPSGWLAGGIQAWRASGRPVATMPLVDPATLAERRDAYTVLDVRQPAEWNAGHIEGAALITGAEIPSRLGEVPARGPLAVICGSGYRSGAIASLLRASGRDDVANVPGGMGTWGALGLPVVRR